MSADASILYTEGTRKYTKATKKEDGRQLLRARLWRFMFLVTIVPALVPSCLSVDMARHRL